MLLANDSTPFGSISNRRVTVVPVELGRNLNSAKRLTFVLTPEYAITVGRSDRVIITSSSPICLYSATKRLPRPGASGVTCRMEMRSLFHFGSFIGLAKKSNMVSAGQETDNIWSIVIIISNNKIITGLGCEAF